MRGVSRTKGEVHEQRPVGADRLRVVQHPDRLVDEVLAQVVALGGGCRRFAQVVVADELGVELVSLAVEEAVEAVESPLQGPLLERPRRRGGLHLAEMPLAERERGVALVAQHLGQRRGMQRHLASHVGEAGVEVGERAHPDLVVVAPGEQCGASRGAERRDVEVGVAQPTRRQRVDVRGGDLRAVAAEM